MDPDILAAFDRFLNAALEFNSALSGVVPHIMDSISEDERVQMADAMNSLEHWTEGLTRVVKIMKEEP